MLTSEDYMTFDPLVGEAFDEGYTLPARFHYNRENLNLRIKNPKSFPGAA